MKDCNISLPFEVPRGYRAKIVQIDYRGYNFLPRMASNVYSTHYTLYDPRTGKKMSDRVSRFINFRGPLDDEYTITSDVAALPGWSACGKKFNLEIGIRVISHSNRYLEETMATLDSMDAVSSDSGKLVYHMLWQKCRSSSGGGSVVRGRPRPRRTGPLTVVPR